MTCKPLQTATMHMRYVPSSSVIYAFSMLTLLAILPSAAAQEIPKDPFHEIDLLCVKAKRDRDRGDYESVEQARLQRWQIIGKLASQGQPGENPLLAGYLAIRDVDGISGNFSAGDLDDPGLVNRLEYKRAADCLRRAWKDMTSDIDGPVLGEVAVRLFEVAQQARGIYRGAIDPASPNCVATKEELKAILRQAEHRDPLCIMATPLLHFLDQPNPKEAFLRAEHRPEFMERQSALNAISHPVVFLAEKSHEAEKIRPELRKENTAPDVEKISEHADKPLLPWHAPVELDKAMSLQHLLDELEYGSYLAPDLPGPGYFVPGKLIAGRDRLSDRFVLLYGRFLICKVVDSDGALRAAELYLDDKFQWQHRYLQLLWRTPRPDERHPLRDLVESMPARHEVTLGGSKYSVRDFPIEYCEQLIAANTQQFCIRDVSGIKRLTFSPTKNDVTALQKLATRKKVGPIRTTDAVSRTLAYLLQEGDVTRHPLVELMREDGWSYGQASEDKDAIVFNPVVLVSDGDSSEVRPHFFNDNTPSPYLQLDDGHRLVFELVESETGPRCYIEYPGATISMPMHFHSVPKNLLKGGKMGAAFFRVLEESGYDEESSLREIQACIEDPGHIPNKFKVRLLAKTRSTNMAATEALREILKEAGWNGPPFLSAEMQRLFAHYGFRYLRDKRGNWIVSRSFSDDQGGVEPDKVAQNTGADQTPLNAPRTDFNPKPPFDFRAQDGVGRIDTTQIYAMGDYQAIKANVVKEHLSKLLRFHPALPVVDLIRADAEQQLKNTAEFNSLNESLDQFERKRREFDDFEASAEAIDLAGLELLHRPFADWGTGGDALQAQTLDSLHSAYVSIVTEYARSAYKMQLYPLLYDLINELTRISYTNPASLEKIKGIRKKVDKRYNDAQRDWFTQARPVLATQLESARQYARSRRFHKAITHYNDLLEQAFVPQFREEGHGLFNRVVNSEEADRFAKGIEETIRSQSFALTVQMELAGVLNAAGLKDSAYFVWRRIVDDERYLLIPAADIATAIIGSYGLRASDRLSDAVTGLSDIARMAEAAVSTHCGRPQWRVCRNENPAEMLVNSAALDDLDNFVLQLQPKARVAGGLGVGARILPEEERRFNLALERLGQSETLGFDSWLRFRKALVPTGEVSALRSLGNRGEYFIHPAQFCPVTYRPEGGISRPVMAMLQATKAEEIRDWCELGENVAIEDARAERACFLLGWYWLDMGRRDYAREAFMTLAEVCLAAQERCDEPIDGLPKMLSALSAIVGGYSIFSDVPGVKVIRSGLSNNLTPQLLDFERRWFAAGLYGPHASKACRVLERHIESIQDHAMQMIASEGANRYFLMDYTYKFGAVPDWLVLQAIITPELFSQITADAIKEQKADAVEGVRWVLIDEEGAKFFFSNLKLDTEVQEDIVNIAN